MSDYEKSFAEGQRNVYPQSKFDQMEFNRAVQADIKMLRDNKHLVRAMIYGFILLIAMTPIILAMVLVGTNQ